MLNKVLLKAKIYAILGLIAGIYFREMTKINGYTGKTQLGGLHTHILILGMFMMLILMLFIKVFKVDDDPKFKKFLSVYEGGLHLTIALMTIRGTLQVLGTHLSTMVDASISGFAGLGHILMGIGFLLFFGVLKRSIEK